MHATAALTLLAVLPSAFGHFVLKYPIAPELDEDNEGVSPCGGAEINFSGNVTNITVGGFAIAAQTTHPQGNWLYSFTTSTAEPYNWTTILPVVAQSGLGDFCLPALTLPSDLAGKQGIIQVIDSAVDGNLYQCAPVNFVAGSASSAPAECTNSSGITAQITTQTSLDNTTSTSNPSGTSSAPAATSSGAAPTTQVAGGLLAVLPVGLLLL